MALVDTTAQTLNATQSQQQNGTQSQVGTQSQSGNQSQNSALQFNQGQQNLQGSLGQFGQQLLSGNIPQSFGMPQSMADWAMYQFEKTQAPRLAHQFGGGTNQIGAYRNELIANLAAQGASSAFGNALNAFNAASGYATRPMGDSSFSSNSMTGRNTMNGTSRMNTNSNLTQNSNTRAIDYGGIANQVGYGLGAGQF